MTSAGSITYIYNGRGDLTTFTNGANVTTYAYNAADQLTSVTAGGTTSTYVYNADGKRVKQTIGSTVTNFLWDEASMYGDVVYEYSSSGSALASYVLGGTGLISQTRGTTTNYFLQDGQGSTRALTNSTTGAITDTYSYTAFGESFATTGTTVNPYRYTGQQFDSSTGLYDLRARYYNPALGRFLSQDMYPVNFGSPIEFNRYAYTANNPTNRADPSGHLFIEYVFLNAEIGVLVGAGYSYACAGGQNIFKNMILGAAFGAGFTLALAVPYVGPLLLVARTGYSIYNAGSAIYDLIKNGYSNCSAYNAGINLLFAGLGIWGISVNSMPSGRNSQIAQEENMALGLRSRPWGAELLERLGFPPKPGSVHGDDILWKSALGLRLAKAAPGRPWWEVRWFVSDSDAGFFWRNGALVPVEGSGCKTYWEFLNDTRGKNFQHGTHVDGMHDPSIIDATRARAQSPDSTVYLPNGKVMRGISLIEALEMLGAPCELIEFLMKHP